MPQLQQINIPPRFPNAGLAQGIQQAGQTLGQGIIGAAQANFDEDRDAKQDALRFYELLKGATPEMQEGLIRMAPKLGMNMKYVDQIAMEGIPQNTRNAASQAKAEQHSQRIANITDPKKRLDAIKQTQRTLVDDPKALESFNRFTDQQGVEGELAESKTRTARGVVSADREYLASINPTERGEEARLMRADKEPGETTELFDEMVAELGDFYPGGAERDADFQRQASTFVDMMQTVPKDIRAEVASRRIKNRPKEVQDLIANMGADIWDVLPDAPRPQQKMTLPDQLEYDQIGKQITELRRQVATYDHVNSPSYDPTNPSSYKPEDDPILQGIHAELETLVTRQNEIRKSYDPIPEPDVSGVGGALLGGQPGPGANPGSFLDTAFPVAAGMNTGNVPRPGPQPQVAPPQAGPLPGADIGASLLAGPAPQNTALPPIPGQLPKFAQMDSVALQKQVRDMVAQGPEALKNFNPTDYTEEQLLYIERALRAAGMIK